MAFSWLLPHRYNVLNLSNLSPLPCWEVSYFCVEANPPSFSTYYALFLTVHPELLGQSQWYNDIKAVCFNSPFGPSMEVTGINAMAHYENEFVCVVLFHGCWVVVVSRQAATLNVSAGGWGESPSGFVFCLWQFMDGSLKQTTLSGSLLFLNVSHNRRKTTLYVQM